MSSSVPLQPSVSFQLSSPLPLDARIFETFIESETPVMSSFDGIPYSRASRKSQNYLNSLESHFVRYPKQHLSEALKTKAFSPFLNLGYPSLQFLGSARAIFVPQYFLSTQLYSKDFLELLPRLLEQLSGKHPKAPLIVRSLCPRFGHHLEFLISSTRGAHLFSRWSYFFDGTKANFWKKDCLKRDLKLAHDKRYILVQHEEITAGDRARIKVLYEKLYREKHSRLNPAYSLSFIEFCMRTRFLEWTGLRNQETGQLDGIIGFHRVEDQLAVPYIGYDTGAPQELGLYRRLFSLIAEKTAADKLLLNYSAGAEEFKRRRGGEREPEFMGVYTSHLSSTKKWGWQKLARFTQYSSKYVKE